MRSISVLLALAASLTSICASPFDNESIPAGASVEAARSDSILARKPRQKDNWGNAVAHDRKKVTIRASKNDTDDISDDFLWALKKANNGGLVHLKKNHKYVIGKKLDLSFLKDVYVNIDGELKYTNDIKYWQANNFYYPFQKSITFTVWGGK
jgi:galacturan 1,4-alpha-galacturonidase